MILTKRLKETEIWHRHFFDSAKDKFFDYKPLGTIT